MPKLNAFHRCVFLLLAWAFAGTIGCGSTSTAPNNAEQIGEAVSHVSDAASSPESFARLFASGAAPNEQERPRYGKYSFRAQPPKISGDAATARVDIISPFTDESLAQADWTCVREGEHWRIKTAPLPADLPLPKP